MENIFVKRKISRKNGKYFGKMENIFVKPKFSRKNGKYLG